MLYELTTLGGGLLDLDAIDEAARGWLDGAVAGTTLGRWRTEIGPLGRILLLRGFETAEALEEERRRALLDAAPFGGRDRIDTVEQQTCRRFPFLPPVTPARLGGVYEFRTYVLKPGGLAATMRGWEAAIAPARDYTRHLVVNMYAVDGAPRITHIWGFESLEQRAALRAHHYAAGLWPPRGGPEQIASATSTIALSLPGSPLC